MLKRPQVPRLHRHPSVFGDEDPPRTIRKSRLCFAVYECSWDLFKSIPSMNDSGKSVFEETVEFNEQHKSHALARINIPAVELAKIFAFGR